MGAGCGGNPVCQTLLSLCPSGAGSGSGQDVVAGAELSLAQGPWQQEMRGQLPLSVSITQACACVGPGALAVVTQSLRQLWGPLFRVVLL